MLMRKVLAKVRPLVNQPRRLMTTDFDSSGDRDQPGEKCLNQINLIGRLGSDPEVRGSMENPVTIFSLATSKYYKINKDSEAGDNPQFKQNTDWHRIAIFKPYLRNRMAQLLKKGDRVFVTGSVQYREFVPEGSMETVRTTSILADDVIRLSARKLQGDTLEGTEGDGSQDGYYDFN